MKIYVAHPITGLTYEEIVEYYEDTIDFLTSLGYEVMTPLCGKGYLRTERGPLKASGFTQPLSTDHAIVARDRWMTKRADVLYVNLIGCKSVSIGCVMELAWAFDNGVQTVVAMEPQNIHRHAFVLESASVVLEEHETALQYLKILKEGSLGSL